MKNKKLDKIGITLSSLGGLLVILNLTTFKYSEWGLELAILAVVIALVGVYLVNKSKKAKS
jgi:hypothetical protein